MHGGKSAAQACAYAAGHEGFQGKLHRDVPGERPPGHVVLHGKGAAGEQFRRPKARTRRPFIQQIRHVPAEAETAVIGAPVNGNVRGFENGGRKEFMGISSPVKEVYCFGFDLRPRFADPDHQFEQGAMPIPPATRAMAAEDCQAS